MDFECCLLAEHYYDQCSIAMLRKFLLDTKELERLNSYRNSNITQEDFTIMVNWAINKRIETKQE